MTVPGHYLLVSFIIFIISKSKSSRLLQFVEETKPQEIDGCKFKKGTPAPEVTFGETSQRKYCIFLFYQNSRLRGCLWLLTVTSG